MKTTLPGMKAAHRIVTENCVAGKGRDKACEEALETLRRQYAESAEGWGDRARFHFVLVVEPPEEQ